jgi:6-phosphofructokinase 1
MKFPQASELEVKRVGPCTVPSPLERNGVRFLDEERRVLLCSDTEQLNELQRPGQPFPSFEPAGPREKIYYDPRDLACGIVTCGGLCPGINDVIRSIVLTLTHMYGVQQIFGFPYGYAGLASKDGHQPLKLDPEVVSRIHERGGSLLSSSRGPQDLNDMIDTMMRLNVRVLFAIGGDGTLRGASALSDEISRHGLKIAVVGIPKTIDNDMNWIQRSFGFTTAVEETRTSIVGAHAEATGAWNGVGLVKLMGRHSGFISAHACLSNSDVNFCLIPEVPFSMDGERGFLKQLEHRLKSRRHAVVVVAEGAGQDILQDSNNSEYDASGNLKLQDIGIYLRDEINRYFSKQKIEISVKYIDPSYTIRSLPAGAVDSEYCLIMGQHAVHAAMAGRTNMVVGFWNQNFTHVPIPLAVGSRKEIHPDGPIWQRVLEATGQPVSMISESISREAM